MEHYLLTHPTVSAVLVIVVVAIFAAALIKVSAHKTRNKKD
ncbi:hypothetical protein [Teredinibacter turnerae]